MHNDLCVGIDLGTTNSVLATISLKQNGDAISKVIDIPRAIDMYNSVSSKPKLSTQKKSTLPSCVYYREENNYSPLVGDFAKLQYALRPHLVAKSIKSQMGEPFAAGLSMDIPDKTPSQISAQILKHMLEATAKIYRTKEITDAVITVPANFDSTMCKATLEAAVFAGIQIKNEDGSERPVLLSEPNAVIYDLINQIQNGEIHSTIIDLLTQKNVMVFDLGGGTLDITMHTISRRDGYADILKVDEIATNRYTRLGGDDFDELIAEVMYTRYLKQYEKYPEIVTELKRKKTQILPILKVFAEDIKIELNTRYGEEYVSDSGWDDDEDEGFSVGGNMGGIAYAYDDSFTKEELEDILQTFMAQDIKFEDYKHIESITDTRNIIYPILDVLQKAAEKMGIDNLKVDAVVVNGGMSKFYMIKNRLADFFGFEPIIALDPDQAVARGAAVYHYYMHKYDDIIKDDMKIGLEVDENAIQNESMSSTEEAVAIKNSIKIEWGRSILNDSLYLGSRNGAVTQLIETGAELPYISKVMFGFRIEPNQQKITIPIQSRNLDGTYRTIASGNIVFKQKYVKGSYVAFKVHMGTNKVITINAWTSDDEKGELKRESGIVEIATESGKINRDKKYKFNPPGGTPLNAVAEISRLIQLCDKIAKSKPPYLDKTLTFKIQTLINNIYQAPNKSEFKPLILKILKETTNDETKMRFIIMARKIGNIWSENEKKELAKRCMEQLGGEFHQLGVAGKQVTTNIQAIFTLGMCADEQDLEKLMKICRQSRYLRACLYTHAKTKTNISWILEEFFKSVNQVEKGKVDLIQDTAHAIGVALKDHTIISSDELENVIMRLIDAIKTANLNDCGLISCILALGCICDQRNNLNDIQQVILLDVRNILSELYKYYDSYITGRCAKMGEIAIKLIDGATLETNEEEYLLIKLENVD
ncbi:Hsp70 family protein [Candidatus Epulonipiscium viviparus]|uniref:Hsp70 family protein n=1 Tax=Candidatus Epulonipiscium viviparus TaxID=420336 RepID=UPI0004975F71|nr:Hsp70 family protein [Candidatus Epulopiscium viviparus]